MTTTHSHTPARTAMRKGMTLLELLMVISVIAALISILLPGFRAVREDANTATCLNNLQQIATTAGIYSDDNSSWIRGAKPTLPWYLTGVSASCTPAYFSEYIYGGFKAQIQHPEYPNSDVYCIADEYRPFNKYIAPGICGSAIIKQYICPSDRFTVTPNWSDPEIPPNIEERYSSWEVNGNSYAINWYWPNYFEPGGPYQGGLDPTDVLSSLSCMSLCGSAMLSKKAGGAAAEFILFMEGTMTAYLNGARPQDWPTPSPLQVWGMGWHGKLSMYCMAMWDGHAEYRFIDARYTSGEGYELWPERVTQWPPECPWPW